MMRAYAITVSVLTWILLLPALASAQTPTQISQAKEHFSIGVDLLDEAPAKYRDALAQFRRAYSLSKSWKVLGNMGLCAHRLERDGEAIEYYRQYLDQGGSQISDAERRDIERDLVAISAGLVRLQLTSDVSTANIIVQRTGSSVAGEVYALRDHRVSLGLRSGAYRIIAQVGSRQQSWPIVLEPAQKVQHRFVFKEPTFAAELGAGGANPAAAGVSAPSGITRGNLTSDLGSSSWNTAGYVVGGLGVAALGTGVFFHFRSLDQEEEAQARLEDICMGTVCPPDAEKEFASADDSLTLATALYAGGAALALTGILLVVLSDDEPSEQQASVRVAPILHPQHWGLQLGGTF